MYYYFGRMPKKPRKAPVEPPPEEEKKRRLPPLQLLILGLFASFAGVKLLLALSTMGGDSPAPMLGSATNQPLPSAGSGPQTFAPGQMSGDPPPQPMGSYSSGGGGGGGYTSADDTTQVAAAGAAVGPDGKPVPGASASPGAAGAGTEGDGGSGSGSGTSSGGQGGAAAGGKTKGNPLLQEGEKGGAGGGAGGGGGGDGSKGGAGGGRARTITSQAWANKRQNFPITPKGIRTPYALNTRIRQAKKRADELESASRSSGGTANGPLTGEAEGELGRLQCDLKHTFNSIQARIDKDNGAAEQLAREAVDCRDRVSSKTGRKGVDDWEAHANLAVALEAQGRSSEASNAMQDAIRAGEASLGQLDDDISGGSDNPILGEQRAQLQKDLVNLEVNAALFNLSNSGDPEASRELLESAMDRITSNGGSADTPDGKRVQDLLKALSNGTPGASTE